MNPKIFRYREISAAYLVVCIVQTSGLRQLEADAMPATS